MWTKTNCIFVHIANLCLRENLISLKYRRCLMFMILRKETVYEKPYSDCFNFGFDIFCGVLTCFCTSAGLQSL